MREETVRKRGRREMGRGRQLLTIYMDVKVDWLVIVKMNFLLLLLLVCCKQLTLRNC